MLTESERVTRPKKGDPATSEGRSRLRIVDFHNTPPDRVFPWALLHRLVTLIWLVGVVLGLGLEVTR